ncbi:MAG: hypothetical protein CML67_14940 [Rhodobacteraceae bacterium]|nr:hypothetical protein [Paracoccaceae bacterium]
MSALKKFNETRRLDDCDRHLAALHSAHPDGPPEDHPEDPMSDGDVLTAVKRARRFIERADQGGL